jgi:hypothetical protein
MGMALVAGGADGAGSTGLGRAANIATGCIGGITSSGSFGEGGGVGGSSSAGTVDAGGMTTNLAQRGQGISIPLPASSTTSRWPQWMHLKKMSMQRNQ